MPRFIPKREDKNIFIMGFSLIEVVIVTAVSTCILAGLLGVFIISSGLNETAKNLTMAINRAQEKMEEIRNCSFDNIYSDYNGATFELTQFNAGESKGSVMVDNTDPDLLEVTVSVCWRQKTGRIFGEDTNLNGLLEAGEDDGNDRMDSPAQLVTLFARR